MMRDVENFILSIKICGGTSFFIRHMSYFSDFQLILRRTSRYLIAKVKTKTKIKWTDTKIHGPE